MKVGCMLRVSKGLQRTKCERMPVEGEPILFGATTGFLSVDPGVTANIASLFCS